MNDQMQDAGLGIPTDTDKRQATDWADLEGERVQRWDRRVNWFFTLLVVGLALVAVFA